MNAYYEDDEVYADALSAAHARGGWRATVSIWLGAGLAAALIGGLVYWSYQLSGREPGEVPILRAALTPAKERPADPGGVVTPYQEIGAYEVAEAGGSTPAQIELAARPPRPRESDLPMGALPAEEQATLKAGVVTAVVGGVDEPEPTAADGVTEPNAIAEAERALIEKSLQLVLAESADATPTPPAGSGSDQAPAYSPLVRSKPNNIEERVALAGKAAESAEMQLAQDAATSQIQVQLGAFPERAIVDNEWKRIFQANRDVLAGRALAVQQTVSGGTVYYRLRVGPFRDGHEANTVCQALKARGQDCLVAINTDRRG